MKYILRYAKDIPGLGQEYAERKARFVSPSVLAAMVEARFLITEGPLKGYRLVEAWPA